MKQFILIVYALFMSLGLATFFAYQTATKASQATRITYVTPAPFVSPSPTPVITITPEGLLQAVSTYRTSNHLHALVKSQALCDFAAVRANEIITNNDWSHKGFYPALDKAPYFNNHGQIGENLGRNYYDNESLLSGWYHSPTHKFNLDRQSYTQACVALKAGMLEGQQTTVVVMEYGSSI